MCAYCGEVRRLTRDHIPPKNIFPKPRSNDTITVPCCEECREGWSKDDEYFCDAIVKAASALANAGGEYVSSSTQKVLQQMEQKRLESAARPEAEGYLHELAGEMIDLTVITPEGIHLPQFSGFEPDKDRLARVAERIIRGLFFHERGCPVPDGYHVTATIRQIGFDPENDLRIHEYFTSAPPEVRRSMQDGAFVYRYSKFAHDKDATTWVAVFHKVPLWLLGFTLPQSQTPPLSRVS